MSTLTSLQSGLREIRAHRARSLLTAFGVVVGVSLVTIMVAGAETARSFVRTDVDQSFGRAGTISLSAQGAGSSSLQVFGAEQDTMAGLTEREIRWLDERAGALRIPHALEITIPIVPVRIGNQIESIDLVIVSASITSIRAMPLATGRSLNSEDETLGRRVAVANGAFQERLGVEATSMIGRSVKTLQRPGEIFAVVGVLEGTISGNPILYVPLSTRELAAGLKDPSQVNYLMGPDPAHATRTAALVQSQFSDAFPGRELAVSSTDDAARQVARLADAVVVVLGAIAAVSLLVGGLAIANVMLMSVRQREPEIGIRRAFGAQEGDIYRLFLSEGMIISAAGGLVGVYLGLVVVTTAVGVASVVLDSQVALGLPYARLTTAVLATVALGTLAGLLPARTASRLDVVAALRND